MIIKKVIIVFRNIVYDFLKVIPKKRFDTGKTSQYRYNSEIFFIDKSKKKLLADRYTKKIEGYWKEQKDYSLSEHFMGRFVKQYELVFERFLPRLLRNAVVADIGCAGGEWSFKILPYVAEVDGFEYSMQMVETAKKKAYKEGMNNIFFECADARELRLESKYNAVMVLGILMYMDNLDDIYKILANIYDGMKPGAYMVTKDTLNCENRDVLYLFDKRNGYEGNYWSKERYYEQFKKAGFVLIDELLMDEVKTRHLHFIAQGAVWQKPIK